jgi:hypothetical protein
MCARSKHSVTAARSSRYLARGSQERVTPLLLGMIAYWCAVCVRVCMCACVYLCMYVRFNQDQYDLFNMTYSRAFETGAGKDNVAGHPIERAREYAGI